MPRVDSDTYIGSANITSIKIGAEDVDRVFVGDTLVFCRGDSCCDELTAPVRMTGWEAGERTLSPIPYAPYGRATYVYGDEVVRYETGVWLYTNATYGELARAYSYAARPWLVNWPAPYAAEQVCPQCVDGCTDAAATNYNPNATCDDGSCIPCVYGCMNPAADNYNPLATCDDFSCTGDSGFKWMRMLNVDATTASGIGQNNITVSITQTGGGMFSHANGAVGATVFPAEYGVPTTGNQIGNTQAGVFTAVFSSPVTDALVAFASVGQAGTPVQVQVRDENGAPKPFTPIWSLDGATTYQNMTGVGPDFQYTQFIGEEGYNIIRIDGTMSSVTFNYTVSENYCTVCFGFVDQNA
jgi:hypothetical protein